MDYVALTIAYFTGFVVTIGKVVTIHPVGADESLPISGAIPPVDGPTIGVVVASNLSGVPLNAWAKVRLIAPDKANDGRIVTVRAERVAD